VDDEGKTAFHKAAEEGQLEALKMLVAHLTNTQRSVKIKGILNDTCKTRLNWRLIRGKYNEIVLEIHVNTVADDL
jgi:hypothetical protein